MTGKLLRKYHHEQARAKAKTEKKAQFDNHSASKAKSSSWTQSSSKTPSKKPDAKKSHGYNCNRYGSHYLLTLPKDYSAQNVLNMPNTIYMPKAAPFSCCTF